MQDTYVRANAYLSAKCRLACTGIRFYPMNLLVVEDEAILAMVLCDHLETEGYTVVGVANNGPRALALFQQHEVDLLVCDINIKGEYDGIETVRRLTALRPVPVIYLTAYADNETVGRAKQTYPAAYLTKPYNIINLRLAIEMALNNAHRPDAASSQPPLRPSPPDEPTGRELLLKNGRQVFLRQGHQFVKVNLDEIQVLEADDIYTVIHTATRKYLLRIALTSMLERLAHQPIVRVHRSYAVNTERVDTFDETEIHIGERVVPLGRHYKDQFLQRLHG
jgi:two-component system, response regulator PdtaR